jgi:hypothetical protein
VRERCRTAALGGHVPRCEDCAHTVNRARARRRGDRVTDREFICWDSCDEYVTKLSQAKDFQDIIRIQTEFMLAQMKAFGEHAKNLGEATAKAAAIAVKNPTS